MYNSTNAASRRSAALRYFSLHKSTQRFVCYNASPRGSASHSAPRLPAAHRASTQLNDLFVTPRRNVAYSIAALFGSTQGFVYFFSRLNSRPLVSQRRGTPHRTSTQRFVCYFATPRNASHCSTTWLLAKQRNELKLN